MSQSSLLLSGRLLADLCAYASSIGMTEISVACIREDEWRTVAEVLDQYTTHASYLERGGRGDSPDHARWRRGGEQFAALVTRLKAATSVASGVVE
jgi:hypothetical protein